MTEYGIDTPMTPEDEAIHALFGVDPERDSHRYDRDPHWRLYNGQRSGAIVPICVQDFDYMDYDPRRFVTGAAYDSEEAAQDGLRLLLLKTQRDRSTREIAVEALDRAVDALSDWPTPEAPKGPM